MSAQETFAAVLFQIGAALTPHGFKRKAQWFTRRRNGSNSFDCVHLGKIPQSASKRIVFQVVSFAGQTPSGAPPLVTSLDQALTHASFEHHIVEGNAERLWTVWPSTNATELAGAINAEIVRQSLPALEAHWRATS
jgi:hypothetical protein